MKNTNSVYDIRGNRIVFQNFSKKSLTPEPCSCIILPSSPTGTKKMKNTNSVYDIRGNRKEIDHKVKMNKKVVKPDIVFQNFEINKTWWFEYDNNNNIIHKKCSDGDQKWYYDGFECSQMEFENNYVQEPIKMKKA